MTILERPSRVVTTRRAPDEPRPNPEVLASLLSALSESNDDYWSFQDRGQRDFLHGLIRYPAMMVPELQGELLRTCIEWDPRIKTVYDPFVGSGTVLTETMLNGRSFVGTDINPLAILTCHAKSGYLNASAIQADLKRVILHLDLSEASAPPIHSFENINKWFEPGIKLDLTRLRNAIQSRPNIHIRRFWWTVLAECIRLVSNSRTSTVKLHLRPESERKNRPNAVTKFLELANQSIKLLSAQQTQLDQLGFLAQNKRYVPRVQIVLGDVRDIVVPPTDLLMTSPPYGDNHTTVTYGQAAYLALQWIPGPDIDPSWQPSELVNTHAIDTASLGGSRKNAIAGADRALDRSATLRRLLDRLSDQPMDRQRRVAAFFRDFDSAIETIQNNVACGGIMLWTVGDRSVGGQRVPLGTILRELFGNRASFVTQLERNIPAGTKRMPGKNSISKTMTGESIVVLRKSEISR